MAKGDEEEEEEAEAMRGEGAEEYSASATVVPFDPPLPLLRGPVAAAADDDPAAGPFVLAFRDARSWRLAYRAAESKVREQCEAGARVGCSITASNKCRPPWWKILFGNSAADFADRERCEEREMALCLAASKEACIEFAKEKCLPPFRDARIASGNLLQNSEFVLWGSEDPDISSNSETLEGFGCNLGATSYRGSVLMMSSSAGNSGKT
ncbi:uncharacterized protein LOC109718370 [Ananas comosus]|uniref:Uncharacterized protein LOC109718370 n=1 Tax=Ananas comosus TaxID=4615 RepID=A0A6P5G4G6_ANACO|nr:uncharacterized protein LOC109718370 [Ananas comosus]